MSTPAMTPSSSCGSSAATRPRCEGHRPGGRLGPRLRYADGGFGHFPGRHSNMDAVYSQLGTLIQAGRAEGVDRSLSEADRGALGWAHAMRPDRAKRCGPADPSSPPSVLGHPGR
jgi:hypothetical protein